MSKYVKICLSLSLPAFVDSWLNSSTEHAFDVEFHGQALMAQLCGGVNCQIEKHMLFTHISFTTHSRMQDLVEEVVNTAPRVHNLQLIDFDIDTSTAATTN